jgi:acetyltransferase-like isoleucine patch superfamily enzyme
MTTYSDQEPETSSLPKRRQPLTTTLKNIVRRTWMKMFGRLVGLSPVFGRLAALPLGPYKDKRLVLKYLGGRAYIGGRAQIQCQTLAVGPRCFIDDFVTIYAHPKSVGHIKLTENVHIYRWSIVELGAGHGSVEIGPNTYIQPGCILNAFGDGNIRIGANCMIAARCSFMPYQHDHADWDRPMREQSLTSKGDIILEDDVWLGLNVCVMDGVTIGKGAIIGAGAVVTKDIPAYTIAAGVPAKVIRKRTGEDSLSLLQELESSVK